jgi:hypothetical protein
VADAVYAQEREARKVRKENAFIGFGLGVAGYWPDTETLSTAFTAVENFYRDQGWAISGHAGFNPTPLITYSLRIQLGSPIGIVVDAASSIADDKVDALSGTLLVELVRDRGRSVRPYIGAGVTGLSFEFTREYKAQISPDEGSGYQTLDRITATGSEIGANFVGGIQFEALHARFIFQAAYWWIPELSDDFGTGTTTTMNLSSFLIGIQLMLTWP